MQQKEPTPHLPPKADRGWKLGVSTHLLGRERGPVRSPRRRTESGAGRTSVLSLVPGLFFSLFSWSQIFLQGIPLWIRDQGSSG